ncbi:unnamed protein product [Ascophyllum nodosum]
MEQNNMGAVEESRGLFAFFFSKALVQTANKDSSLQREEFSSPDFHEVFRIIKDCLVETGRQTRLRLEHATGWNVLRRLSAGCQILHFTGHGCDQFLAFEAEEARRCGIMEQLDVKKSDLVNADDACAFSQVCSHLESRKMFSCDSRVSIEASTDRLCTLHPPLTLLWDNNITPP